MDSELADEFELDDDEKDHFQAIENDILETLYLTNSASAIVLNSLGLWDNPPLINTAPALVSFLMAKTANSIRNAVRGLKLGYYASTATILRSALESLSFAFLFDSNPSEVAIWLRNEFSNRPQKDLTSLRDAQKQKAINSMLDLETQPKIISEVLHGFKKGANKHTHATMVGLAKEFNIDIGTLLPDEITESEGNLDDALDRYALLSKYGENILNKRKKQDDQVGKDEMVWIQYTNQYIRDELFDLSIIAFYLAHRLLDLTQSFSISDHDFQQNYREWHKESKNRGISTD